jgi:hypothetical protein
MGRRASKRVKAINLKRIFQSLKGFTDLAPDSIYQRGRKISNALTLMNIHPEKENLLKDMEK